MSEETNKAIRHRWLYTGGIAKMDQEIWVYIADVGKLTEEYKEKA